MLLNLLWLSLAAYLIVQVLVLWRSAPGRRLVAGAPLIVVLPVLGYSVVGLVQHSSLWPLLLLLTGPLALAYVVVVLFAVRRTPPALPVRTEAGPSSRAFVI